MSTLRLTTISNQGGTASVPSDTVINGTAKAWVNFNGTGTVAIRGSFNVSSITDHGVGSFAVNMTNAVADTNYTVVANSSNNGSLWSSHVIIYSAGYGSIAPTTTSFRLQTAQYAFGAMQDNDYYTVAVFR